MNDLIKKGFYLGLGAAFASKEKAEKYINELASKGDIPQSEAKRIIEELSDKGKQKQESWNEQFKQDIASSFKQLGFVSKEEFSELEQRVNDLENKLREISTQNNEEN